jgi:hypothetical protein
LKQKKQNKFLNHKNKIIWHYFKKLLVYYIREKK